MKNMRIPLLIAWGVAILGIILGSFLDFQLSSAIASAKNGFGLTVSAIGPTIGFSAVALMGGGFIALIVKGKYHIALKILFGVLALCCLGVAIYYPAGEYFGINGFYGAAPEWAGYLIAVWPALGALVGGYFLFKDNKNDKIWIVFCSIIVLLLLALLLIIPQIKDNMHRPRFRAIVASGNDIEFHNWWEKFSEYSTYKQGDVLVINGVEYAKDNFKSFPSGHTAEASIPFVLITFMPLANEKFKKVQLPMFIGTGALVLLVAFSRILAAAHFLSDVSWGATIILSLLLIANEVIMRVKPLQLEQSSDK